MAKLSPASAAGTAATSGKKKTAKEYTGRQKAAIFLVTIGSEISAEIFKYLREDEIETTIMVFLIGLAVLLIAFLIFRAISREMERRRRLEAEERARREEQMRQDALARAEEDGMDVSISVEERTRLELQESVMNMTREHPEDAAQLIRTWLLEE